MAAPPDQPTLFDGRWRLTGDENADATADETLRAVRDAARMESAARARLADAVTAARAAGHSWRVLGIASGIPHQTLHRRSHQRGSSHEP